MVKYCDMVVCCSMKYAMFYAFRNTWIEVELSGLRHLF